MTECLQLSELVCQIDRQFAANNGHIEKSQTAVVRWHSRLKAAVGDAYQASRTPLPRWPTNADATVLVGCFLR
jgi:hypothetical protein